MIFPVLEHEERLQLNDKTRLSGVKSFKSPPSETSISTITVTPGLDGSAQNIYDSTDQENWYLDWIFESWTFDIVTGFNDKIDFNQGGVKAATLDQGTYTLAQLVTEIQTQLNAVSGISGTFSVSSSVKNKLTISNDTASFELLPVTGVNKDSSVLPHIGFKKDISGSSVLGKTVEYGHKRVALTVNNGGGAQTEYKYIQLYNEYGDYLFSSDQDLISWESDIMKWVRDGRATYLDAHREAQDQIIHYFDRKGYVNIYDEKYTKFDFVDKSELKE